MTLTAESEKSTQTSTADSSNTSGGVSLATLSNPMGGRFAVDLLRHGRRAQRRVELLFVWRRSLESRHRLICCARNHRRCTAVTDPLHPVGTVRTIESGRAVSREKPARAVGVWGGCSQNRSQIRAAQVTADPLHLLMCSRGEPDRYADNAASLSRISRRPSRAV